MYTYRIPSLIILFVHSNEILLTLKFNNKPISSWHWFLVSYILSQFVRNLYFPPAFQHVFFFRFTLHPHFRNFAETTEATHSCGSALQPIWRVCGFKIKFSLFSVILSTSLSQALELKPTPNDVDLQEKFYLIRNLIRFGCSLCSFEWSFSCTVVAWPQEVTFT